MNAALNVLALVFAWVGHAFWLTVALNVVYALPLHRKILRTDRLMIALLVFAFPIAALWWTRGQVVECLFLFPNVLSSYLVLCLFIGVVVLPGITLVRVLRKPPAALTSQTSRIIDVSEKLGGRPLGYGEHWRMARLPFNQLFQVEFSEKTLALPRLPAALNGLSILHVSDFHFHGTPEREFFETVIDEILNWPTPDIVCMTGDFVDTLDHHRWIKPLLGRLNAKEGKFAILGNHDYWCEPDDVRNELRRAGFSVLSQETAELDFRGERILLMGHEGPWFPAPLSPRGRGVGGEGDRTLNEFRILLSHTPDNIGWAKKHDIHLMLSGHTHGGQVRLPLMGSMFVPSRYSRKYDQGVFWESPTLMHVVRGLSGREPLRWNCRPEVTLLKLAPGESPGVNAKPIPQ